MAELPIDAQKQLQEEGWRRPNVKSESTRREKQQGRREKKQSRPDQTADGEEGRGKYSTIPLGFVLEALERARQKRRTVTAHLYSPYQPHPGFQFRKIETVLEGLEPSEGLIL